MSGAGIAGPSFSHPILQTYVDVCVLGCLELGRQFLLEFLETTHGFSGFWLNDREVPRRPWIHQPRHKTIDRLLADSVSEHAKLPEEYSALYPGMGH